MNPLGRAAVLVLCSVLLAACGDQTSSGSGADDPTPSPSRHQRDTGSRDAQRERDRRPTSPVC